MGVNKVIYGTTVLVDLTGDSVTPESLVVGSTAHDKSGSRINGENPYKKAETDETVAEQADLLDEIKAVLATKMSGGTTVIQPVIEALEITENGTYTAPAGIDGYSPVVVNVATSGGDTVYSNDVATSIGQSAFYNFESLRAVEFTRATSIGTAAFGHCSRLTSVNFPKVTTINAQAFANCGFSRITQDSFPMLTSLKDYTFYANSNLSFVDFTSVISIGHYVFVSCKQGLTIVLRNNEVVKLNGDLAFYANDIGYIYVPSALVDSYKAASNWSTYASKFRALENYTVDGTTTGALDESKI